MKLKVLILSCLFVIHAQSTYAGLNVVLDLDETVLKEVPITQAGNPKVQSIRYQPNLRFYQKYKERLSQLIEPGVAFEVESGKFIHYDLHDDTQEMTGYLVVRPGIDELLKKISEVSNSRIYLASNNDPARTEAVAQQLNVGGKKLSEWGATVVPKSVFNPSEASHYFTKSLDKIRKWAGLSENSPLIAIDDHPELYSETLISDQVIGVSAWDYSHGILQYLSGASEDSQTIVEQNLKELNFIWEHYFKLQNSVASELSSLTNHLGQTPPSQAPPAALKLIFSSDFEGLTSPTPAVGHEVYSIRPDVTLIQAIDHSSELPSTWKLQRQAHLEAVAEILEMYPDWHIYFLARDSELLYDFAKIILFSEPEQLERIHLLNVSRANMSDANLLAYLAQAGISELNLNRGMKVLFVDTGFSGTIPKTISEKFPQDLRNQLKTHLMSSANPLHPSTRVFLEFFLKGASETDPSQLHTSIIEYEHMPHFTFRSRTFVTYDHRWDAAGVFGTDSDGQVSRTAAQKYREDLKFYALSDAGQPRWRKQRGFWRAARFMIDHGNQGCLKEMLEEILRSEEPLKKAMVRDLLELVSINEPGKSSVLPAHADVGLKKIDPLSADNSKLQAIHDHPEWKSILENPATEIPKLVLGDAEQIQTLRNIIDVVNDLEIGSIISKAIAGPLDHEHEVSARRTLKAIIQSKPKWYFYLIRFTFSSPTTVEWRKELAALILQGDEEVLMRLAQFVFVKPHSAAWADELRVIINRGHPTTLLVLAMSVFSQPHSIAWKEELSALIEKGDQKTLQKLALCVFSKPHSSTWKEELSALIEKGDPDVLLALAISTFSKPHSIAWRNELRALIHKRDQKTLQKLATYAFSQPHSIEWRDELRAVIDWGNQQTLYNLADYVFSQPHSIDWVDELRILIDQADQETLMVLAQYTFVHPHSRSWKEERKSVSARILRP